MTPIKNKETKKDTQFSFAQIMFVRYKNETVAKPTKKFANATNLR